MGMRILIVEDEHKIANAVKQGLIQHAFAVDAVYDGDEGVRMATSEPYDLIILDRMLPGSIDGIGIVQELRTRHIHTPVLLLTAKDRVLDRAEGLNAGADDYLVKPFAFVELIARVRALLRRPHHTVAPLLTYQDVSLDPQQLAATRGGTPITLTAKEFALLEYFMRHPDQVLTKDTLMQHVWDYDADILPNTVEVYVGYLRAKIDKPFTAPPLIHTKRGFGYYFGVRA